MNARGDKLRVAVIGAGNMGHNHIRNYFMLPEADLVGVSDISPKFAEIAKQYKAKFFTDYKKMIEELKPDAVSVVVPTPLHLEVGAFCLTRHIHCLIEKPIAYSISEADRLIQLAKINQVILTIGHIERYNPLVRTIKDMIDNKKLGKVTSIVCKRVGGFPNVEPKTDVIIDLAVHDIDIINYILGSLPKRIYSHGSRTHHTQKVDSAEILMDYGYASGFVQANWLTPVKIRTIAITGSKGYIEGNYITQELEYYQHNMKKIKSNEFPNFVIKMGKPKKVVIKVAFEEPLKIELQTFLAKIGGDEEASLVDPFEAREALRLAQKALLSQ